MKQQRFLLTNLPPGELEPELKIFNHRQQVRNTRQTSLHLILTFFC